MWIEFFILGGIWWWLLTALFVVTLIWEISGDRAVASFFTLGLYVAIIHFFGNATLFSTVASNPAILYIGIPVYFLSGTIWAFVKWFLYVRRDVGEYKKNRLAFLERNGIKNPTIDMMVPDPLKISWAKGYKTAIPQVRHYKGEILTWMTLWPFSFVWTIIDEPWRYIYDTVANTLQRISNSIYREVGYDDDIDFKEEEDVV